MSFEVQLFLMDLVNPVLCAIVYQPPQPNNAFLNEFVFEFIGNVATIMKLFYYWVILTFMFVALVNHYPRTFAILWTLLASLSGCEVRRIIKVIPWMCLILYVKIFCLSFLIRQNC